MLGIDARAMMMFLAKERDKVCDEVELIMGVLLRNEELRVKVLGIIKEQGYEFKRIRPNTAEHSNSVGHAEGHDINSQYPAK